GLPWTPPVAALAIVPATTSTANAMRRILSGFMGSVSARRPANTIGRRAGSGGIGRKASRTRLAKRLVRAAAAGDDSRPGLSPIAVGPPQHFNHHPPGVPGPP